MNRKKITAFFLSLCLCVTSVVASVPVEVLAETTTDEEDEKDEGFLDGIIDGIGDAIGGIIDKIGNLFENASDVYSLLLNEIPDDEMKILNSVMNQKFNMDVNVHKKKTEEGEIEEKVYNRWFDLELYKNTYNLIGGAGGTITGKEVMVPPSVPQTGIINECTNINYVGGKGYGQGWVSPCRELYDLWVSKGETTDRGIATLDGYYLMGCRPQFGTHGDVIAVKLEDGTVINCIIFDIKGTDAAEWGHVQGGKISVVEWECNGPKDHVGSREELQVDLTDWRHKKVVSITNGGPYVDGLTGPGGAGGSVDAHRAEDDDPYYEFKSHGDYSSITDVGQIFMDTKWAAIENLLGSVQVESSVKAILSDEMLDYEDDLDAAAEKYGFPVYKELFKAIAEYRHKKDDDDIFRIEDTGLNPSSDKKVSKESSIAIAAQLFAQCLERANYPDFTSANDLKALLQAFEFESTSYIIESHNKYTLQSAQKFAKKRCKGKKRTDENQIEAFGLYDYRDQKFPDKVLKYYSVISVDTADMTAEEQALLSEAMASWPSNLDSRRKTIIEKALSLYGKVSYSMGFARSNPNPDAPIYQDCSSYVGWSCDKSNVGGANSGYTTVTFLDKWKTISKDELIPGDVGLLSNTREEGGANHVGFYIGKSSTGSDVWLHCTGYRGSAHGYPGPYVQGDPYVKDNWHTINRGIMITDQTGRSEGYVGTWTVFKRNPLLGAN